jgi:purine-nucleoside phosphorylase
LQPYLRPTAPIAADVLLPSDPGTAMQLAQRVMVKPLMANHHHGLWGYSGRTAASRELTVQSTGIGGPGTAAVVGELAARGARRLIRIGTCTALDASLTAAQPLLVTSALGADGTTVALGGELTRPDPELTDRLAAAGRTADIVSFDLGAQAGPPLRKMWHEAGISAVDMETAALFAVAERLGLAAASLLVVAEIADADPADEGAVRERLLELGQLGAAAMAAPAPVTNVGLPTL